jgi:hypothetical protein
MSRTNQASSIKFSRPRSGRSVKQDKVLFTQELEGRSSIWSMVAAPSLFTHTGHWGPQEAPTGLAGRGLSPVPSPTVPLGPDVAPHGSWASEGRKGRSVASYTPRLPGEAPSWGRTHLPQAGEVLQHLSSGH